MPNLPGLTCAACHADVPEVRVQLAMPFVCLRCLIGTPDRRRAWSPMSQTYVGGEPEALEREYQGLLGCWVTTLPDRVDVPSRGFVWVACSCGWQSGTSDQFSHAELARAEDLHVQAVPVAVSLESGTVQAGQTVHVALTPAALRARREPPVTHTITWYHALPVYDSSGPTEPATIDWAPILTDLLS